MRRTREEKWRLNVNLVRTSAAGTSAGEQGSPGDNSTDAGDGCKAGHTNQQHKLQFLFSPVTNTQSIRKSRPFFLQRWSQLAQASSPRLMKLKGNSLCLSFVRAKRSSQRAHLCSCPPCRNQNHPLYFKPQWLPSVSVGSPKLPMMTWPAQSPSASPVRSLSDPQTHSAPCSFCVFK